MIFSGGVIKVPDRWDVERRTILPPVKWWLNAAFSAIFHELHQTDPYLGVDEHNLNCAEVNKYGHFAWLVSGISGVQLRVVGDSVRELVNFSWAPAWVPIDHIRNTADPSIGPILTALKAKWEARSEQSKTDYVRELKTDLHSFMAAVELEPKERFYAHKLLSYAEVECADGRAAFVRVDFSHSYEHCSALGRDRSLWKECYQRRLGTARRMLSKNLAPATKSALESFVNQCLARLN